jgi:glucosamine 6-phosphate synthetase-like amidotransferase/phosphosugar isomerase protein
MELDAKPNWKTLALHDSETCVCARGKIGKAKAAAANEKRRAYYKTDAGIATKEKYREKAAMKRQIINQLTMLKVSKKAVLSQETIANLVKLL